MPRNTGMDYTVVRNGEYSRSRVGNIERHNERKNQQYSNQDVQLEKSDLNFYFKKPEGGYLETFDKMCESGKISTKGLKPEATIMDEFLFDVNTEYFEKHGGYDFALEFFQKVYEYAVKEVGGEEYILSAVMHADERNQEVSERLGKDVYHYHLHVMYIPVVEKEVRWTKRCKDVEKRGTIKEIITQVSHSKK
ncbi:MAG: plasmid recombination protein [Eubacteriales bacterium]